MAIIPMMMGSAAPAQEMDREQAANIEAWTEQATKALHAVSLAPSTPRVAQGQSVTLSIPLDGTHPLRPAEDDLEASARPMRRTRIATNNAYGRREPIRRDSLKRRDALLKGKEGSRQRRRWENGRCS